MSNTLTTKTNTYLDINVETKIQDLPFDFKGMILEQAFAILCWQSGNLDSELLQGNVRMLADRAKLPVDEVIQRLRRVSQLSCGIWVSLAELRGQTEIGLICLDTTSARDFPNHQIVFLDMLDRMTKNANPDDSNIAIVGADATTRYSAALALREKGLKRTRALL